MSQLDKILFNIVCIIIICFSIETYADSQAEIVDDSSTSDLIRYLSKCSFNVRYPIFRIYAISNSKSIKEYLILTEHKYDTTNKSVLIDTIQAYYIRLQNNTCKVIWTLKDFVIKNSANDVIESTIWFWSKYIRIQDIDKDGNVDFFVVYGTKGLNGFDDGRMKLLIYYKNKKVTIRHQNGVLDFERYTYIDSLFYNLPESIQVLSIAIIGSIIQNGHSTFPLGWKESLRNKKLLIEESNLNPHTKKE